MYVVGTMAGGGRAGQCNASVRSSIKRYFAQTTWITTAIEGRSTTLRYSATVQQMVCISTCPRIIGSVLSAVVSHDTVKLLVNP